MTIKQINKQLQTRIGILKRERDKLRALEDEIHEYRFRVEDAVDNLQSAVDILSEVL